MDSVEGHASGRSNTEEETMRTCNYSHWLTAAVCALTTAAPASASTEENIGVGSGAVIGAVAAGPVGLIIGAAIGAKVGDTLHRKNDEIGALETSLADSRVDCA